MLNKSILLDVLIEIFPGHGRRPFDVVMQYEPTAASTHTDSHTHTDPPLAIRDQYYHLPHFFPYVNILYHNFFFSFDLYYHRPPPKAKIHSFSLSSSTYHFPFFHHY